LNKPLLFLLCAHLPLGRLERDFIYVWLSRTFVIAHAWRRCYRRASDHSDSASPSHENKVFVRKNSNSRIRNTRHYYCNCWLNRELKHHAGPQATTIKLVDATKRDWHQHPHSQPPTNTEVVVDVHARLTTTSELSPPAAYRPR
jgi:hypothetical protein